MKKNSTLIKIYTTVTLLGACCFCASAQTSAAAAKPVITYQILESPTTPEGIDEKGSPYGTGLSQKEINAAMPWYNYKGIAGINEAKQQWIKDNPAAYKKMQEQIVPAAGAASGDKQK